MKVPDEGPVPEGHSRIRRNRTFQVSGSSVRKQEELEDKLKEAFTFYLPLFDKPPASVPCL